MSSPDILIRGSAQGGRSASDRSRRGWQFVERPRRVDSSYYVYKAETNDDLDAVNTLWDAVYGEECGWLRPADGPRYEDRYHAHSTYLMARAEGRVVGTMRMVADSQEGLPVEQFVSISDLRHGKRIVECQRLMTLREYRNRRWQEFPYGVLGALVKAGLHWCIVRGFTHIFADLFANTKTTPIGPLKGLGFEETGKEFIDTELDEPDLSLGLLLTVGELFSRPFRTDSPFYRYLMEYDEYIDVYG